MSQNLHFYKLKIFPEDLAAQLKRDEIDKALKALLANYELDGKDEKLRERIFEEIEVDIDLSGYEPKIKEFFSNPELFVSPNSRIFLMTEEIWAAISECIFEECNKAEAEKEEQKSEAKNSNKKEKEKSGAENAAKKDDFKQRLEPIKPLLKAYFILDELFNKKLLFVNIF